MNSNKKTLIGGSVAVATVTTAILLSVGGTTELTGTYTIDTVNPYLSEITITVPEEFTPDICELKFNDLEVTKMILPDGKFKVYPVITSNPDKLSMDMYVRQELAGTAEFNFDGTITIKADKKYVSYAKGNTAEEGTDDEE